MASELPIPFVTSRIRHAFGDPADDHHWSLVPAPQANKISVRLSETTYGPTIWVFDPNDSTEGIRSFSPRDVSEVDRVIAEVRERLAIAAARHADSMSVLHRAAFRESRSHTETKAGPPTPTLRDTLIARLRAEFGDAAFECKSSYNWTVPRQSGGTPLNISLNSAHKPHRFSLWIFDRSAAGKRVVSIELSEERDIHVAIQRIHEMIGGAESEAPHCP